MTMPSSGTIDLQDAAIEFFGGSSGGTGGLNASAGGGGFLKSSGISTLGVSVRNALNNSVPAAAPISMSSLYGASGANALSLVKTAGPGTSATFSTSIAEVTVNSTGTGSDYDITVSTPAGTTISSIGTSSLGYISGPGTMVFSGGWTADTANTWRRTIAMSGMTASPTRYVLSAIITDSLSRTRTLNIDVVAT